MISNPAMKKIYILFLVIVFLFLPAGALAQSYLFSLDQLYVDVFMNDDGTLDLLYQFTFSNAPGAAAIDFVDVGLPNRFFNDYEIQAEVNGVPVAYVSSDEYQGGGHRRSRGSWQQDDPARAERNCSGVCARRGAHVPSRQPG
jgi:hypothetical protein